MNHESDIRYNGHKPNENFIINGIYIQSIKDPGLLLSEILSLKEISQRLCCQITIVESQTGPKLIIL